MMEAIQKPRFILGLVSFIVALCVIAWFYRTDLFHRSIMASAGMNPLQKFAHISTDYQEAGIDFVTVVCLGISEQESSIDWTPYGLNLAAQDREILEWMKIFAREQQCVGTLAQFHILSTNWSGENITHAEVLFLDLSTNRLLLVAASI